MTSPSSSGAAPTWFKLVHAYASQSDLRRKVEARTADIQREPTAWQHRFHRGNDYLDLGQAWRAMTDYDQAMQAVRARAEVPHIMFYNRAIAHGLLGDHRRAIAELHEALLLAPKSAPYLYVRGLASQLAGDHQDAVNDYDQAAAIDRDFALTFYNRAGLTPSWGTQASTFVI